MAILAQSSGQTVFGGWLARKSAKDCFAKTAAEPGISPVSSVFRGVKVEIRAPLFPH